MDVFDPNMPIYVQVMQSVKKRVAAGKLKGGAKLPWVRDLADQTKVNPNTVQRAYQELEREGITETKRGMGTFITENPAVLGGIRKELSRGVLEEFVREMTDLGFSRDELIEKVVLYLEETGEDRT